MKKLPFGFLITLFFTQTMLWSQSDLPESTGYVGDNFSLEGALALLKTANSPEDFEKLLNQTDNDVNNLDLDEDGEIDYIRVFDQQGDNTHALILQVAINEGESQDIAVIAIEKIGTEEVTLQIIGDEDIFGEQKIIEPFQETEKIQGHKGGDFFQMEMNIIVNVWYWPSIRYVYAPAYRPWVSPWKYRVYPKWYRSWRPRPFHVFSPRTVHHRVHFRPTPIHRVRRAHNVYHPHRRSSLVVHQRTTAIRKGKHGKMVAGKKTTKTTVVQKKGQKTGLKHTKTTTKVGKKGNKVGIKKSKTTTKVNKKGKKVKVKKTKTKTVRKRKKH